MHIVELEKRLFPELVLIEKKKLALIIDNPRTQGVIFKTFPEALKMQHCEILHPCGDLPCDLGFYPYPGDLNWVNGGFSIGEWLRRSAILTVSGDKKVDLAQDVK